MRSLRESGVTSANPLFARFVRSGLEPGGRPLLEVLGEETIDEAVVRRAVGGCDRCAGEGWVRGGGWGAAEGQSCQECGAQPVSPTLLCCSARARIHARIDRLSPESDPVWGTMSARKMVCHVADQLGVALGDTEVSPRRFAVRLGNRELAVNPGLLRYRPIRYPLVHWQPWPRERIGCPPEMWETAPSGWQEDIATLHALVDRVGDRPATRIVGQPSLVRLGPGTGMGIALLATRHPDHHLRQFGV